MGGMHCICGLAGEPECERKREMDAMLSLLSSGYRAFSTDMGDMIYLFREFELGYRTPGAIGDECRQAGRPLPVYGNGWEV